MTLKDKKRRATLNEGRNYQMGFAFLKKVGSEYHTVQPISPCKDYLNDVVYSEATGKPCCAYGLSYKKQDIYDGDKAYIAVTICEYQGGGKYGNYDKDVENLKTNYKNMERYLNRFEEVMGIEGRTTVEVAGDNLYLVTLPLFWTKYTYLISAWSLLMRIGQFYNGTTEDLLQFALNSTGLPDDAYIMMSAKPNLERLMSRQFPEQNFDTYGGGTDVHNCGIVGFKFMNA